MIGQEILRLPEIGDGTPEAQLRAIRSYLYRLAEQLQYLLAAEKEERLRSQEGDSRRLRREILESPETAQRLEAITGRQFSEGFVKKDALEDFLRQLRRTLWDVQYALSNLETGKPAADIPQERLCMAQSLGAAVRREDTVAFVPFEKNLSPLQETGPGHYQIP